MDLPEAMLPEEGRCVITSAGTAGQACPSSGVFQLRVELGRGPDSADGAAGRTVDA